MMMQRSPAFFLASLLLLGLSIPHASSAQASAGNGSEPGKDPEAIYQEGKNFYFAIYTWPVQGILTENSVVAGVPRVYYHSPEGIRKVPMGRNVTSPLMHYRGPMPLELFDGKWVDIPPPEDAPPGTLPTRQFQKKKVADLTLPESWNRAMLIAFPGKTGPDGGIRILPIRYDADKVKTDHVRIHNTTNTRMILDAEDKKYALPANGILDFRPANSGGHHAFRASFYSANQEGKPQLRYSTRMVMKEGESTLYLLYKMGQRRFRLQRIGGHELPPPPDPTMEER